MIVIAGSFTRYDVPAFPDKTAGKVCASRLTAGTIRYNGYSTSGRRSRNRRPCSQSARSRGRLMQASDRIVKTRSRAVCHGSGICSASGCPVGTFDNSPAIHRWVSDQEPGFSPVRTAEAFAFRNVRRLHFSRPYGTEGLVSTLVPSDKSLGYSHKVPTGQCPRCAVKTDAATLRIRFVSKHNSSLKCEKEKQPCTDL